LKQHVRDESFATSVPIQYTP